MAVTEGGSGYTHVHEKKGNVLVIKTYLNGKLVSTTRSKVERD